MLWISPFLLGFLPVALFALCLYTFGWRRPQTSTRAAPGYTNISQGWYDRDKQRRRAEHAAHFAKFDPPLTLD